MEYYNDLLTDISYVLCVQDCLKVSLTNKFNRRLMKQTRFDFKSKAEEMIQYLEEYDGHYVDIKSGTFIYSLNYFESVVTNSSRSFHIELRLNHMLPTSPVGQIFEQMNNEIHQDPEDVKSLKHASTLEQYASEDFNGRSCSFDRKMILEIIERALYLDESKITCD